MPTPRRLPRRTTRGMPTAPTGMPTDTICTPTGITVTPATSAVTPTGITCTAMGIVPNVTRIADIVTGTAPSVTAGRLPDRASFPTGTGTGPVDGTFIRLIARAPTTATEPDARLPAAC